MIRIRSLGLACSLAISLLTTTLPIAVQSIILPILDPRVFLSGGLAASLSHTAAVPIDVIKTKQQIDPQQYGDGFLDGFQKVISVDGPGALLLGGVPTLSGYFVQGSLKYGLYGALKPTVASGLHLEPGNIGALIVAAIMAECVASGALCPIEAVRIKQCCDPTYGKLNFLDAMTKFLTSSDSEGSGGSGSGSGSSGAFDALGPILLKMCPYSAGQLATYEVAKSSLVPLLPFEGVFYSNLACAALAAVVSSLVSQPGDSLLSEVSKEVQDTCELADGVELVTDAVGVVSMEVNVPTNTLGESKRPDVSRDNETNESLLEIAQRLGINGLFRGTSSRLVQMLLIVVVQLLAVDTIRVVCGLPPMGQ